MSCLIITRTALNRPALVAQPARLLHLKPRQWPVSDLSSFTRHPSLFRSSSPSSSFSSSSSTFTSSSLFCSTHSSPSPSLSLLHKRKPFALVPTRSKMTSSSPPAAATPAQQSSTSPSAVASSPVHARSHPFLRKYQPTISTNAALPQQNQASVTAVGSSAFSTSSASGSSAHDSSSRNGRKNVDDAIAAVAAKNLADRSPTAAAADAADAIFNRRLSHLNLDKTEGASEDHVQAEHKHEGCCSGSQHTPLEHFSDEEYQSLLPPISEEARQFSERLLGQNKAWAQKTELERPGFFAKLEKQQKPQVLWIGCSDSRVPANQIVNLDPGEIFVHRNIANVVTHTDMNLLSVLEYAVDVLKVRHIIICGHYGCGGVAASLTQKQFGIIDNWLRNIKDLYTIHRKKFEALPQGGKEQHDLLTELNVIQSALNVCHTSIIQKAWSRGAELSVHSWCYRLSDGVIRNLGLCIEGPGNVEDVYHVMADAPPSK